MYSFKKEIEVVGEFDVLVAGGGCAGFAAAISAARRGAKVALLESMGSLGGVMTWGGNPDIGVFYAWKKQIISGIGWELCQRLYKQGWATIPDFSKDLSIPQMNVSVNPAMCEHFMNEMCIEADVELLFHTSVTEVIKDEKDSTKVLGVIVHTKQGLAYIKCTTIIDCTGDGDVAAFAGAKFEKGEELQPATYAYYLRGYDSGNIDVAQADASFRKARAEGRIMHGDYWPEDHANIINYFYARGNNTNHIVVDYTDNKSISKAEITGRGIMARMVSWAKSEVYGAENLELVNGAPAIAPRESRRILCEEYITSEDYIDCKSYPDAICYTYYSIDLHTARPNQSLVNKHLAQGNVPVVPYRALIPKGINNMLIAGRCISSDRLANSALRVKASCFAMGQAAGEAAALVLENGGNMRSVEIEKLKGNLEQGGAIVPQRAANN